MGTHATISVEHPDLTVNTIYLHWDGYPDHALVTLMDNYNTYELAANLCSLGDLSALDDSADCPLGHSFDNPVDGYCVFYGRDRSEDDTAPQDFENLSEMDCSEQYNYVFSRGSWSLL